MNDFINMAFNNAYEGIGEAEIATVAMEYWMKVDKYREFPVGESWHLPMLAFQLGYLYCKERHKLDD